MFETSNDMANCLEKINTTEVSFRMATVEAVTGGKVYLTFYGDATPREKGYKRLSSYNPTVGDNVLVAKLKNSYTILGKVI